MTTHFNATRNIAQDPTLYKPVMNNHYILTVTGLDGMRDYTKDDANAVISDSTLSLKIANQTFAEPSLQQGTVEIRKGNMSITFPGTINAMSSSATFQVYVNKSAYDILYSWKMASGNHETGEIGDPGEYWKKGTIDLVSGNRGTIYGTWTLPNLWISSLQGVTFSNDSSEIRNVNVTMHYYAPTYRSYVDDITHYPEKLNEVNN